MLSQLLICYMKKWKQHSLHFDSKELLTDLGSYNFIFVGSGTDMTASDESGDSDMPYNILISNE